MSEYHNFLNTIISSEYHHKIDPNEKKLEELYGQALCCLPLLPLAIYAMLQIPEAKRQVAKARAKAGDAATSLLDEPEEPKKRFAPKADETSALEQAARAAASGMTPAEYEEATRMAANKYLADNGAHIGGGGSGVQTADFLKQLWNVDSIPAISDESKSDSTRVLATVYEIGGPLTNILSTSVAKQLPLIPHVGIRVHG